MRRRPGRRASPLPEPPSPQPAMVQEGGHSMYSTNKRMSVPPLCLQPAPLLLCSRPYMQVFELFDIKRNSVIEFGEFVRSLSVFHPKAPLQEKARCEGWHGRVGGGGAAAGCWLPEWTAEFATAPPASLAFHSPQRQCMHWLHPPLCALACPCPCAQSPSASTTLGTRGASSAASSSASSSPSWPTTPTSTSTRQRWTTLWTRYGARGGGGQGCRQGMCGCGWRAGGGGRADVCGGCSGAVMG